MVLLATCEEWNYQQLQYSKMMLYSNCSEHVNLTLSFYLIQIFRWSVMNSNWPLSFMAWHDRNECSPEIQNWEKTTLDKCKWSLINNVKSSLFHPFDWRYHFQLESWTIQMAVSMSSLECHLASCCILNSDHRHFFSEIKLTWSIIESWLLIMSNGCRSICIVLIQIHFIIAPVKIRIW